MQVRRSSDKTEIIATTYRLTVDPAALLVRMDALDGSFYYHQSMISAVDTMEGIDVTTAILQVDVREHDDEVLVEIEMASSRWRRKRGVYRCSEDRVIYHIEVEGRGNIDRSYFFRGTYQENQLASIPGFDWVYPACTNFLEKELFHASEYTSINAGHEAFAWGYALASGPLCFALGDEGESPWLSVGLAPRQDQWNFQSFEFSHRPTEVQKSPDAIVGTQAFSIAWYGHEKVDGMWQSPPLVMQFAPDRHAAVERYVDYLYESGASPPPVKQASPAWWSRPIFCGWHEQMSIGFLRDEPRLDRNYLENGARARDACTQENYERWLAELDANGCRAGTVIIDALWQKAPDINEVDETKWPDMRGFIDACHARGQHVILWLSIWKHAQLPEDECAKVKHQPACGDPTNPIYQRRLTREIEYMLSDANGCLNADGFKVDGQTIQPFGYELRTQGEIYGFALQRKMLEFIYLHAKQTKPDAMVSLFSANPYFADICDMVRLGDLYTVRGDPIRTMQRRARIIRAGMRGKFIDTDGALRFNLARPIQEVLDEQVKLGIPTIYNARQLTAHRVFCQPVFEELDVDDYRAIARVFEDHQKLQR